MRRDIDQIDATILDFLQDDGRMTRSRLAGIVGRSIPAVSARIRKLENDGVIAGFYAAVDSRRLDRRITAFVRVALRDGGDEMDFVDAMQGLDEIIELHAVTDPYRHMLKIRTRNSRSLERLLQEIERCPDVQGVSADIVLSTYRETRRLPIPGVGDGITAGPSHILLGGAAAAVNGNTENS